jgi:hypothetical protein
MSWEQVLLLVKEKGYVHFCVWFLHLTMQHPQVIDLIYFANEAWFHSWIFCFEEHNISEPLNVHVQCQWAYYMVCHFPDPNYQASSL